jgi:hypothetical protein
MLILKNLKRKAKEDLEVLWVELKMNNRRHWLVMKKVELQAA